jgi:hypothetical protein
MVYDYDDVQTHYDAVLKSKWRHKTNNWGNTGIAWTRSSWGSWPNNLEMAFDEYEHFQKCRFVSWVTK